jgi:hypothetical protein
MAKESKLYIYIDILENAEIEYFMLNKISNYKVALNGKLCNIGKLEPCDNNLVKIRDTILL